MKELVKVVGLLGTGFVCGYLYYGYKTGKDFEWESENGAIKVSINSGKVEEGLTDIADEIETAIDSLND